MSKITDLMKNRGMSYTEAVRELRHPSAEGPSKVAAPVGTLALATGSVASSVHFSSATPEWATPQDFYDRCHAEFRFTLDPCSTRANAKCEKHYTLEDDGLSKSWGNERVWMNPPYGREIGHWMRKAWESAQAGALVVCLVPARTDTGWWHDYATRGEIRFVRGRLKFGGHMNSAPFPSALVILRPQNNADKPT
jgi:site-specific DNA-methyltransferase (adenine-specific)